MVIWLFLVYLELLYIVIYLSKNKNKYDGSDFRFAIHMIDTHQYYTHIYYNLITKKIIILRENYDLVIFSLLQIFFYIL